MLCFEYRVSSEVAVSVFALCEAALTVFSELASVFKSLITMVTSVVCFVFI